VEEQTYQHHTQREIVCVVSDVQNVIGYGAELCPLTVAQKKKLEAAH